MHIEKASSLIKTNTNFVEGVISDISFIGSRVVYEIKNDHMAFKYQTARPIHIDGIDSSDRVRLSWGAQDVVVLTH